MPNINSKNWPDILREEFEHPSTILWRAIELKQLDAVLNKYNPQIPILDLGCAEGKITDILFNGKHIFGLDNCWGLIKQNWKVGTYKALVLADGRWMPFKENSFRCVFSNCVIEHIPDLKMLLNEVERVLKHRGLFIFTVPSAKFGEFLFFHVLFKNLGLNTLANWYSRKRNSMLNHFHCYDHVVWQEKLKNNNFSILEYKYYMPKKAVMLWDFLAALIFIINKIKPLAFIEKNMAPKLNHILNRYYDLESPLGGGLLIVALKNYS